MAEPLAPDARRRLLVLVSVGAFVATVDAPIVSVATPDIAASYQDVSLGGIAWVLDAYFIAFAATLLTAGRLADRFGRRAFFIGGMWLFAAGSLACALAPTVEALVAARIIQAIGGAAIIPAGQAALLDAYPQEQRYQAISALATAVALGSVTAPTLGGVLVEVSGWELIFWLSAAIGAIAAIAALRIVHAHPADRSVAIPDPIGVVAQITGVSLLVYGILATERWEISDPRTWGAALAGLALVAIALRRSMTSTAPSINVDLFRNSTFALASAASFLIGFGLFAFALTSVLFFAGQWGFSPLEVGLSFIPGSIASAIAGRRAPMLAGKYGPTRMAAACATIAAVGCVLIVVSTTAADNYFVGFVPGQVLYGFGVAAALTAMVALSVMSAPPHEFASASGLNGAIRQIGGALGVAAVASVLSGGADGLHDDARIAWLIAAGALLGGALVAVRMSVLAARPAVAEGAAA